MLDFLDTILLRRSIPQDDWTTAFRRFDGDQDARVLYFLPWNTPFAIARSAGCLPLPYLACYEMPPAIVSSEPQRSVEAMKRMLADANEVIDRAGLRGPELLVVGLSVGTYPATYLASRRGSVLCSVASADRGDLMVWQSPAAKRVKERAIQKGFRLSDFAHNMRGYNPVENMFGLRKGSMFVVGDRDQFVPTVRSQRLLSVVRAANTQAKLVVLPAAHVATLLASSKIQQELHRRFTAEQDKTRSFYYSAKLRSRPRVAPADANRDATLST